MSDTHKLTYEIIHYSRGNYDFTAVRIRTMRTEDVAELLDGAVDNKAGYHDDHVAQRARLKYEDLLARDVKTVYSPPFLGSRVVLTIEWQHYKERVRPLSYCEASLSLGDHYAEIQASNTFLRSLGQRIERARARRDHPEYRNGISSNTFSKPDDVIAALARMRTSTQIARVVGADGFDVWVATPAKIYSAEAA